MNYTGYLQDEDGNNYYPTKELKFNNFAASSSIRCLQLLSVEIGGIYLITMSYNFNYNGSPYYRSCFSGILTVNCGYNGSNVVVRPKLDILANYYNTSVSADTNIGIICEGGGTEIAIGSFLSSPQLYLYFTNTIYPSTFKVKIRKLN